MNQQFPTRGIQANKNIKQCQNITYADHQLSTVTLAGSHSALCNCDLFKKGGLTNSAWS